MKAIVPKDGEKKEDFLERCADDKGVREEYSDAEEAKAFCLLRWTAWCKKKKKKKARSENTEASEMAVDVVLRAISDSDKSAIKGELKKMSMTDVVATHRRLHQFAAKGAILSGFSKSEMNWLHSAVEAELVRRAKEDGRDPPEPTPLKWGSASSRLSGEDGSDELSDEDFIDRHFPQKVKSIIEAAKKKKKKKKASVSAAASGVERRYISGLDLRLSDGDGDEEDRITGYAAVFNRWSEDLGMFKEKIAPGAFAKTIAENDVRALINHDPNLIIGRTKNKTLKLWEDDEGLGFEVKLPDTTYANDLRESIKRKDITQNSFGFKVIKDEWSDDGRKRVLHEVKLFDVSPVTFPAYKQTSLKMRLREIGIDYEALEMALIRRDRCIEMQSDVDLIESTIEILRSYIPKPAAEPSAEAVDGPEHSTEETEPENISTQILARITNMRVKKTLVRR